MTVRGFGRRVDEAGEAGGGVFGEGVGAGEEGGVEGCGSGFDGPEFGVILDECEAVSERGDEADEVFSDEAHDVPEGVVGGEFSGAGEAAEEGDVDGRVEAAHDVAFDAEPSGGFGGAAAVEPLGGLEPIAELAGVLVDAEVLEDEAEGADGRGVFWELVVVEIRLGGVVFAADIDDGDGGIGEVGRVGIPAFDGGAVGVDEDAAGEEIVFVGAAGVGENGFDAHL